MPSLKRPLTRLFIILFAFGLIFAGCAFLYQEKLIYHPRPYAPAELKTFATRGGLTFDFKTSEGEQHAYYYTSAPAAPAAKTLPKRLWVVTGGNAARALGWASFFAIHGHPDEGYLLVEYPGYGACAGKPSPDTIRENVTAALNATAEHFDVKLEDVTARISVLGHSLGAAAALTTAIDHGAERIVLVSPFTSMKDMASDMVGKSLATLLTHRFDNRASLRALDGKGIPTTIIHGLDDDIIRPEMGKELADMFPDSITWIPIEDAGHNDIFSVAPRPILDAMAPQKSPDQ